MACLGTAARTDAKEYGKLISSFLKMKGIDILNKQLEILHHILQYVVNLVLAL
jgi:hypothetical protein